MKKRILHLIQCLGWGGAEGQLVLNLSAIDQEKFGNYVCYLYPRHDRLSEVQSLNVPAYCLNIRSGKLQWPVAVLKVRKLIRELDIDLVHTSNYESDLIGGLAGKLSGVPVISTLTNVAYEPERFVDNPYVSRSILYLTLWLQGAILRRFHTSHIAISQAVKESYVNSLGLDSEKIEVIYRSLPDDWFQRDNDGSLKGLTKDLGVVDGDVVLLTVGRLVPQKGHRYLVEAMSQCVEEYPNLKLIIVGDGVLKESLIELRNRLELQKNVTFLGNSDKVRELLEISDIFVFPSVFEGLGNALLEAAGVGKPCIVSDIPPFREILENENNGIFVPPQDSAAISKAIQRLVKDLDRGNRMGRAAAESIKSRFRISKTVKKLELVYKSACSKTPLGSLETI